MAKLKVEMDTEAKTMTVSIDGKTIDDVSNVSAYCYKDYDDKEEMKYCFNVSTHTESDSGVRTYMNMCASKSPEGVESLALGAKEIVPGVVENLVKKYSKEPQIVKPTAKTLESLKNFIRKQV